MNVGDYVKTPYGIRKVKSIAKHDKYQDDGFYVEDRFIVCGKEAMKEIKSSPNIIDLIEVGDYVNGHKVLEIEKDYLFDYREEINVLIVQNGEVYEVAKKIYSNDIKSIVTKEQFESMEYKVGE